MSSLVTSPHRDHVLCRQTSAIDVKIRSMLAGLRLLSTISTAASPGQSVTNCYCLLVTQHHNGTTSVPSANNLSLCLLSLRATEAINSQSHVDFIRCFLHLSCLFLLLSPSLLAEASCYSISLTLQLCTFYELALS